MKAALVVALLLVAGCGAIPQEQYRQLTADSKRIGESLPRIERSANSARDQAKRAYDVCGGSIGQLDSRIDQLSNAINGLDAAARMNAQQCQCRPDDGVR